MATYPGGIYDPTNPSPTSPRNNPSLAGEVSGANNEIVAIETALGTNLGNVVTEIMAGSGASVNHGQGVVTISATGGAGGGWPTDNGSGSGNLQAQTASVDSVGYNMTDNGAGGLTLTAAGTGGVTIQTAGPGSGVYLAAGSEDVTGVSLTNLGDGGGVNIQDQNSGGVNISSTGTSGIQIADTSGAGVSMESNSSSPGILIENTGGGGVRLQTTTGGITVNGKGGVYLNYSASVSNIAVGAETDGVTITVGTGGLVVASLPTSDPHNVGALYSTAGVVHVSAG